MDKNNDGPQLETVIVFTRQMAQLASWYKQALGLAPFEASPGHLGQQVGSIYLGFDQVDEGLPDMALGVTLWFTVDDIESTFAHLVKLGARVRYPPTQKPWGATLASVYDPDGNAIGIAQRQPASTVTRD